MPEVASTPSPAVKPILSRWRAVLPRRILLVLLVPNLLLLIGTTGYYFLEPAYSLFDALYMTVITLTTVGYTEVHELSTAGRAFTMLLLLGGVFTLFYMATEGIRAVVSGELQDFWGKSTSTGWRLGRRSRIKGTERVYFSHRSSQS